MEFVRRTLQMLVLHRKQCLNYLLAKTFITFLETE